MKAVGSTTHAPWSEATLWEDLKRGKSSAFAEIYRRYVNVLFSYGCKITSNPALVEDSIQDLFIYLWKTRERLGDTTSIKFYLFKSLRREIIRKLADEAWLHESVDEREDLPGLESVFSHEAYLIETQMEAEKVVALQKALSTLTKRQREAITLRFYHNFSYEEIGGIMSLHYKSVCNLIYKSLHLLKENIVLLPV